MPEMPPVNVDIQNLSATELIRGFRRKVLSPVEVAEATLKQIESFDDLVNAFTVVDYDGAMAAARRSEQRWMKGEPLGLIDGVPSTVKDVMLSHGWPSLKGSRTVSRDQTWTEDSPSVARLREHGAVLLGKTTMAEFGWKATGDSPLTGITRNPWNPDYTPGGSSSGAAASVAAGMGVLAVGTDGGGSIRIPCSFTGLVGFKATFGRVPNYPANPMGMLVNVGPMARTVADCALLLSVLCGFDDREAYALEPLVNPLFEESRAKGLHGLRVAYIPSFDDVPVDPDVLNAVDSAAKEFSNLGAHVEILPALKDLPREAFIVLWAAGLAYIGRSLDETQRALLDPGLAQMIVKGEGCSAADFVAADLVRSDFSRKMAALYRTYDLLLTPTVATPALPVGQDLRDPERESLFIDWAPFSYPFNLTRQPAITVPCGLTRSGLPIGLQIVGRRYDDAAVLKAASAYEALHPYIAPNINNTCKKKQT
jgi:aspartyl-tRNA(Asn)/glutamyl-tRNA(Gln) amidotransferase subunit A